MSNNIVTINISQQIAPAPSTLQRTGAFVSQGGTNLDDGESSLLTQFSDLAAILAGSIAVSSMALSTGIVTVTTASPHGIPNGDVVEGIIAGVTPSAYNGTFNVTSTGASTFTYPLGGSPGAVTVQGVFTLEDVRELVAMATTFFAQGNTASVYVLELGTGEPADGVAALTTYIADPTLQFYSYLPPVPWADEPDAITLASQLTALTKKTYLFMSLTLENYSDWANGKYKSLFGFLPSPDAPVTEFGAAWPLYVTLNYAPSQTNKLSPTAFKFGFGVTQYSALTGPQQTALKVAKMNWAASGAEGGISDTILKWGTTGDGRDFTYWYAVDWIQINVQLDLANAVINGSNNALAPLDYDQPGINTLQGVAQGTINRGSSYAIINSATPVAAIPFAAYTKNNPSDFSQGIYNGLSVTAVPQRGFTAITFNFVVSDIPIT